MLADPGSVVFQVFRCDWVQACAADMEGLALPNSSLHGDDLYRGAALWTSGAVERGASGY